MEENISNKTENKFLKTSKKRSTFVYNFQKGMVNEAEKEKTDIKKA